MFDIKNVLPADRLECNDIIKLNSRYVIVHSVGIDDGEFVIKYDELDFESHSPKPKTVMIDCDRPMPVYDWLA
jgi:hypothetical protein